MSVELILGGDPRAADVLARLLYDFRHAIDGGLRGISAARKGLLTAVELTYLHTGAHASALRLYRLSLEGRLKVEDEPARLIGAAVERGTAGAGSARVSAGRARRKT